MKNRRYSIYFIVITYVILLKIILSITVGIQFFSTGTLFDIVLMMFWVGVFPFFMRSLLIQKIYYLIIVFLTSIFVIGDSLYYDYFGVISAKTSFQGLLWLRSGNTLEYNIQIPLIAYLITPILLAVVVLIIKGNKRDVFRLKDFKYLSLIFVIQVGFFIYWGAESFDTKLDYYRSDGYLFESMHDRILYSEKFGYFNYHLLDFTKIRQKADREETIEEIDTFFNNQPPHNTNDMSDQLAGYNLITILVESLDTRFIDPILTPNLYQMREEGIQFNNYYTPVFQQGATCNSEYMSISGLGAITTNDWSNNICDAYSDNAFPYSLPNQLNTIGYDTYYFHNGYEWFYNRKTVIPNHGFETVKFQEDIINAGYSDFNDRFDTQMLHFFDEYVTYDTPFYINLLTYSGHGAYNQKEFYKYNDIVNQAHDEQLDSRIRNYMQKLVETDKMIGLIKERLEENNALDNTLFVIFPDHYPYMLDKDVYESYINETDYKKIMKQDLIMYAPNITQAVVDKPASTIDITPTVLNMIDSSLEFKYFTGDDLFNHRENFVFFSDLTITDGERYLSIYEKFDDPLLMKKYERILEQEITILEIEKKLLNSDYFRSKGE